MSDSMVERVADAVALEHYGYAMRDLSPVSQSIVRRIARAAIEAMLPPTEAMVEAGAAAAAGRPVWHALAGHRNVYRETVALALPAAITAALDTQAVGQVTEGRPEGPSVPKP